MFATALHALPAASPSCAFLLAQNGADVIKVEPPRGDWVRQAGKKYGDLAAGYVNFNRGKRAICLDFKTHNGMFIQATKFHARAHCDGFVRLSATSSSLSTVGEVRVLLCSSCEHRK